MIFFFELQQQIGVWGRGGGVGKKDGAGNRNVELKKQMAWIVITEFDKNCLPKIFDPSTKFM